MPFLPEIAQKKKKPKLSYQEVNLDFISKSKILTKMAIEPRGKLLK